MLFVHYFSNLQFHQKGSSLTDPQKFRLTPGFQRRGSIELQKKEAQETLHIHIKPYHSSFKVVQREPYMHY